MYSKSYSLPKAPKGRKKTRVGPPTLLNIQAQANAQKERTERKCRGGHDKMTNTPKLDSFHEEYYPTITLTYYKKAGREVVLLQENT